MSNKTNALSNDIFYTYSIDNMSDKNVRKKLVRRLLKNLTNEELIQLIQTREQICLPIPKTKATN